MSNYLSIVHIVPNEHKTLLNELAELLGMGSENLSVKFIKDTDIFWGCHSWWSIDKYILFKDTYALSRMGIDIYRYIPALNSLSEFLINTENMGPDEVGNVPNINIENALEQLGLTLVQETI